MKAAKILSALFPLFFVITSAVQSQNPTFNRAWKIGGTGGNSGGLIIPDASGACYVSGGVPYGASVDADPGLSVSTVAGECFFVEKFDAAGNFVWVKRFGGKASGALIRDAGGNFYMSGVFSQTVDFDPGAGTFNLSTGSSSYMYDFYIAKYDNNLNFLWAKKIGIPATTETGTARFDKLGNLLIGGTFEGTVDFDPGSAVYNLSSPGGPCNYLLKLDANGNFIWAKNMSFVNYVGMGGIAVDDSNNLILSGTFEYRTDFDPGPDTAYLDLPSGAFHDRGFVQKLDANGNFLWAKAFGSINTIGQNCVLDNNNNIYINGVFAYSEDFDPGPAVHTLLSPTCKGVFILKLDAGGNYIWAKADQGNNNSFAQKIFLDGDANVYITGQFWDTDFDPGSGRFDLVSQGNFDGFIQKLDANGNFLWAQGWGGADNDYIGDAVLDATGNIWLTANFSGTMDCDPGAATHNVSSYDSEGDFALIKLNHSAISALDEATNAPLKLYPNPTTGRITIDLEDAVASAYLQVTDITGRKVFNAPVTNITQLDLEGPAGVYFATILFENKRTVLKVMKQ